MTYRVSNFINGQPQESRSERQGAIFNPACGKQQGSVGLSSAAECQEAIAIAERAFADWSQTPPLVRARVFFRFKELMEQHSDELAQLISREHGKVFWVLGVLQHFWYSSDKRRERSVAICRDRDVQQITFDAYMNKRLVRNRPFAHARIFFKDMAHLLGLARV